MFGVLATLIFFIVVISIFAALIMSVVALPIFIVFAVLGLVFSIFGLVFKFIFGGPLLFIIIVACIVYFVKKV